MLEVKLTGKLIISPEEKVSKAGVPYVFFKIICLTSKSNSLIPYYQTFNCYVWSKYLQAQALKLQEKDSICANAMIFGSADLNENINPFKTLNILAFQVLNVEDKLLQEFIKNQAESLQKPLETNELENPSRLNFSLPPQYQTATANPPSKDYLTQPGENLLELSDESNWDNYKMPLNIENPLEAIIPNKKTTIEFEDPWE